MNSSFPTRFQLKWIWYAVTALALTVIGSLSVGSIWLVTWLIAYLQPLLVPLAVAAVLAYLLNPLTRKLAERTKIDEKRASTAVFVAFIVGTGILATCIAIPVSTQAGKLIQSFPNMTQQFGDVIEKNLSPAHLAQVREDYKDHKIFGPLVKWLPEEIPPADPADASASIEPAGPPNPNGEVTEYANPINSSAVRDWAVAQLPVVGKNAWEFVKKSVGGFLGVFGFVIGFFLVPIYLFFFLRESNTIKGTWSDYLPLRASKFKREVVDTLTEINGYLAAFFRGQMLVSLIDGLITAILLSILGLKFGLLVGVLVGILGIIPYLGILACYIPAVIIATVQGAQHGWYMAPDAPWWVLPMVVTIIFVAVNNIDGILIAPKIVGDSVGLHPFTVIFSVIFWSSLLGGLLGAILAVPLTASIKVLFQRYIWDRRIRRNNPPPDDVSPSDADPPTEDEPDPEPA